MSSPPVVLVLGARALATARRIRAALGESELHGPRGRLPEGSRAAEFDDLGPHLRALYQTGRPLVVLAASGLVVRLLAVMLADKRAEPPVVVVAEDGSAVVPLLGGHRGANRLARRIASTLGCPAAITTAGDLRLGFALDEPPAGWVARNPAAVKAITAALLDGEAVALRSEAGDDAWLRSGGARFAGEAALEVRLTERDDPGSDRRLVLHPQVLALGVGCERDVAPEELIGLVEATLACHGLAREALASVVSIDLKADEPALEALAAHLGLPARFFRAEALEAERARLANPSPAVFAAVGAHGVAEAAALAAAGPTGELLVPKTRSARATCAVAKASAPIDPTSIGRPRGHLAVVGLGPGDAAWRTGEATALLDQADDWVGYQGYLDRLERGEGRPKAHHGFALGEEEARARLALDLAAAGRQVALISSGDPGIYAMAALVLELLEQGAVPAWQGIRLTVSPGVSALQAAAARAGAPLGHDFCAISLSDLLTPWSEIERRLRAAAEGDFVTVLYNPASGRRRQQLGRALVILAGARLPETPVVHARSVGRVGEQVEVHRLSTFEPATVDMLSLLIVGSTRTRFVRRAQGRPLVYTPRGYSLGDQ